MQLTRLTIENLRAIERFDVDLADVGGFPRRRLVLLGANGSGKSTILDAVAHAFQVLSGEDLGAKLLGARDIRGHAATPEEAERAGTMQLEAYLPELEEVRVDPPRVRGGVLEFTVGSDLDRLLFAHGPVTVGVPSEFRDDVRALLRNPRPPCVLLPANRGALEDDEQQGGLLVQDVTSFDARRGCLAKGRARFAPLAARLAYAYLGGESADPQGKVRRMWKVLERYVPELPRPTGVKGLHLWFRNGDGSEVPLSALSDGERAILLLFGELALRAPEHGVILIDDVEQYLHPRWQLAALEGLPALVPTAQFVFATQAPYVAACAPDDVVEVGDWKRHGE